MSAISLSSKTYLMIGLRNIHNSKLLQVIVSHSGVNAILEEIIVGDYVSNILTV
jgi:hypothetical protein